MKNILRKSLIWMLVVLLSVGTIGTYFPGASEMDRVEAENQPVYMAKLNPKGGRVFHNLPFEANTTYTFSCEYYVKTTSTKPNLQVAFFSGTNDVADSSKTKEGYINTGYNNRNKVCSLEVSYTTKAATDEGNWLSVRFDPGSMDGNFYVWNIKVVKGDSNENILGNADFTDSQGFWYSWQLAGYESGKWIENATMSSAATTATGHTIVAYDPDLFDSQNSLATWSSQPILEETLNINYKTALNVVVDSEQTPTMEFVMSNGTEDVKTETVNGILGSDGKYNFDFKILPQQMAYTITATLTVPAAGSMWTQSKEYSMREYCETILSDSASSAYLKDLIADLLRYGAETQAMYGVDNTITSGLDDSLNGLGYAGSLDSITDYVSTVVAEDQGSDTYVWKSASLVLDGKVTVRLKFTASSIENLTVKVNDNVYKIQTEAETGVNYVDIPMTALSFDEVLNAKFYLDNATEPTGATLSYSVNTYLYRKRNSANQKDLLTAIYNYGQSAERYHLFSTTGAVDSLDNELADNWDL